MLKHKEKVRPRAQDLVRLLNRRWGDEIGTSWRRTGKHSQGHEGTEEFFEKGRICGQVKASS